MFPWSEGISLLFSRRRYVLLFLLLSAILMPLYAVLTDIVVLQPLSLNESLRLPEAILVLAVAILASLGFTLAAFQIIELRIFSKAGLGTGILGAGAGGTVLAAFASACSVCQPIWLFWLGLGSAAAFLPDYGIYILAASIAILAYSLNSGFAFIVRGCRAGKKRA